MSIWDSNKSEQELFEENEYLIRYVLKRFPKQNGIDHEDLYQEGAIALLTVIRKVREENFELKSTYYVEKSIFKRVRRFVDYQGTSLHVSRRLQGNCIRMGEETIDNLIINATTIPIYETSDYMFRCKNINVEDDALVSVQAEEIRSAVERLPQKRKQIMLEYFNCGMDIEETARKCGCSKRTVYRARAFFREKIRYLKILEKDSYDG